MDDIFVDDHPARKTPMRRMPVHHDWTISAANLQSGHPGWYVVTKPKAKPTPAERDRAWKERLRQLGWLKKARSRRR